MDWLDILAVQGNLKSLLQHHSSKASILRSSAFFTVQLSHPYMTTGKTIALTIWTFAGRVISLLFNMLPRFLIAFLSRSKRFLIWWLQSPSTVILEPKKIKSAPVSTFSPSICHEVIGLDAMILVFWKLNFKPAFSLSSSPLSRGSLVPLQFLPLEWLSAYLRLLIFLPAILIPACTSSNLAIHMRYPAYKLNKQGDSINPWHTPFPVLNQCIAPCPVLDVASWPVYRLLRCLRLVCYFHRFKNFPQFVVIHTVKVFGIFKEAEVDVFLEFYCFFYDPMDVGNLISGSSSISKSSLYFWKFSGHVMLMPRLKGFENYFAIMWN